MLKRLILQTFFFLSEAEIKTDFLITLMFCDSNVDFPIFFVWNSGFVDVLN